MFLSNKNGTINVWETKSINYTKFDNSNDYTTVTTSFHRSLLYRQLERCPSSDSIIISNSHRYIYLHILPLLH